MTRESTPDGMEAAPQWIMIFLGAYLAVQLSVLYFWNIAVHGFSVQGTPDGASAVSVTAMAAVGFWLSLVVLRSFPQGAPLHSAWVLFTWAAGTQAASGVLAGILGTNWLLNPLTWAGPASSRFIEPIRRAALVAGGPIRLVLLAAAMLMALRVMRRFGLWVRPGAADWAMAGIVCLFALCRFGEAGAASFAGRPIRFEDWTSLAGLPALCVLFLEAMLLRQSVVHMGNGLITKCWVAIVCGILFTGAGELACWVIPHYSHAWPLAVIDSLTRFATAGVFALAPACQVAAQRRAIKPASDRPRDLATGVPALAR